MRRAVQFLVTFSVVAFLRASEALGIAPNYVSDQELAKYPIIVVAKWDKAPAKSHIQYGKDDDLGEVVLKSEVYTRLNVLATVKGAVEQGEHDLIVNWGITWNEDGTFVNSGTSTQLPGDVNDTTVPCLWFLKRSRSWDEKRKDEYLTVGNYREVQPLELKEFYVALGNREAPAEVPKLLRPDQPLVARRILHYLCGGVWPWPYDDDRWIYNKPETRGPVLRDEADRVWEFLQTDAQDQRRWAACVYAELAGKDGVARMRTLLDDKDPNVRGIAVGVLSRHRDEAALDRFGKATQGLKNGAIACQVIKELLAWKDDRTVPALIGFLQNDDFAYRYGDDLGIPALKAQQALVAITEHEFPYDVEMSQKAWQKAMLLNDKSARKSLLEKAAPGGQAPLVAAAVGVPTKELSENLKKQYESLDEDEYVVTIRLRNLSSRPVTILTAPSEVEIRWPGGVHSRGGDPSDDQKLEFTTIQPTDGMGLEIVVAKNFLVAEPAEQELKLSYLANGNRQGVNAWIGTISVQFGADWKYKREVKHVEELWENGNLKATGTTVNGVKLGEWNYFNEAGDRIKIAYHQTFRGTSICNPEHPKNKGAGKRPAK
jgi:hypothetical protein